MQTLIMCEAGPECLCPEARGGTVPRSSDRPSVGPDSPTHQPCHPGTSLDLTEPQFPICKRNVEVVPTSQAVACLGGRARGSWGTVPGTTERVLSE